MLGQHVCRWDPAVEKMEQFRGFGVQVGDVSYKVEFEQMKELVAEGKAEPVSGIGDGAFWDFRDGTGMVALVVKDGPNDIKIRMDSSSLTDAQMKPLELAVARDVVANL